MAKSGDFGGKFIRCERSFAERFAKISFGNARIDAQTPCQRLDRYVRGNRKAFTVFTSPFTRTLSRFAPAPTEPQNFYCIFREMTKHCRMPKGCNKDRDAAAIFKALGHPARVRMLRVLAAGERCVCDLVEVSGLGWSTVSRHLSVMKAAGVLADEKRGKQVIYRLELPCAGRFLACLDQPGKYPELHAACACGGS